MGEVYKLDLSKDILKQILELIGWHKGRKVDITDLLIKLKEMQIDVNKSAERFWKEFYGLKDTFYFKITSKYNTVGIGGNDFSFDTNVSLIFPIHFMQKEDYIEEIVQIPFEYRRHVVPICEAGFHDPGILWIAEDGKIFWTLYFDENKALTFDTLLDYFESEFYCFKYQKEVLITFDHKEKMKWLK